MVVGVMYVTVSKARCMATSQEGQSWIGSEVGQAGHLCAVVLSGTVLNPLTHCLVQRIHFCPAMSVT